MLLYWRNMPVTRKVDGQWLRTLWLYHNVINRRFTTFYCIITVIVFQLHVCLSSVVALCIPLVPQYTHTLPPICLHYNIADRMDTHPPWSTDSLPRRKGNQLGYSIYFSQLQRPLDTSLELLLLLDVIITGDLLDVKDPSLTYLRCYSYI